MPGRNGDNRQFSGSPLDGDLNPPSPTPPRRRIAQPGRQHDVSTDHPRGDPQEPIACLYPAAAPSLASQRAALPPDLTVYECAAGDPRAALAEAAAAHPDRWLLLIAAEARLPEGWWPRVRAARAAVPEAEAWTPLCAATPTLAVASAVDDDAVDCWAWALSERAWPEARAWSPLLSLWSPAALDRIAAPAALGVRLHLCDALYVSGLQRADAAASPHSAAATLARRIAATDGATPPPRFGLSDRPVLLHVLHGWGGGAQRFVEDLIDADTAYQHLVLLAESDPGRRRHGDAVSLHAHPRGPALRRWSLAAADAGTRIASDEYRALLDATCADFAVAGVLVSSLIGHALDALRTGLPTAVVCHDYYPLWPRLHADFGDATIDFGADAIPAALAAAGEGFEFAERDPRHWQALRAAYLAALDDADALLIAPSTCVRANQCRIAPALAARRWVEIPHGLADWPSPPPAIDTDPHRASLRIVVPGRVRGGKGETLLAALLERLPDDVELVLLGCGAAGMRFFGHPQAHVQLDYRREDLPRLLAGLRPDAALLPATVAETFSYTLSELRSLGVPVIATALGAFVERIDDGVDGLLVAPDADALAARLRALADDSGALAPLRRARPQGSTGGMVARYADALPLAPRSVAARVRRSDALLVQRAEAAEAALRARQSALVDLRQRLAAQSIELDRRAQWAQQEHRTAQQRLDWAKALQAELGDVRSAQAATLRSLDATTRELEERSRWALALAERVEQLEALCGALEEARGRLEQDLEDARADARALTAARDELQRYVDALIEQRDAFERERNEILASSSWRLTRPLRYARRLCGNLVGRLRFRLARIASLRHRLASSLRRRGLAGTLARIRQEYAPPVPSAVLDVPAVPADDQPLPDTGDLVLPSPSAPRASVIVPVYNHLQHTLTCLRSLAEHPQRTPFEVIVVDDCSQDASADLLPRIAGLRYQRNRENLGFIGACNAGGVSARGEYLVFLNNDTAVQSGWLDALVDTFARHPGAGLVGAKLVYPDGRLQEAGGIVFDDASGWNYGRFDDPADPRYNYLREADYCSGAAIAVPAELFHAFGGFDPHYAPAYYEDTDLAMKVHQAGHRVLYQPASVVVHFEGISSGTDTSSGIKAYQVVNRDKFLARWREALVRHPAPPPATPIEIAREHRARRRVLVIDATTPQPDQDSGSVRMVNLLRLMVEEGCAVTFFADNRAFVPGYSDALQQLGVEVLWHPWLSDPPGWFAAHGARFDAVILSRHYIAGSYIDLVRRHCPRATLVFDTVDLHYLLEQRAAELAGRDDLARAAADTRRQELDVIARSDVTLVVSPVEQTLLATDAPGARVEVLSNVHEVFGSRRSFAERRDLMFIGGFQHPPNIDAATWFVDSVWPLIRARDATLRFHLIGSKATDEVRALGQREGVIFQGFVEDIEPFLDGCRLAVAPLRYGAGVKGKVNMSMSYGQPVVATPIAVEGMHLVAGEDVLVAQTPEDFADAVLRLHADEALWNSLSARGVANVERHFGFDSARAVLRELLALR